MGQTGSTTMQQHVSMQAWLLLVTATAAVSAEFTCPPYEAIRQPSVDPSRFQLNMIQGTWYNIATTEPTIPHICPCNVNNLTVDETGGWYTYTDLPWCGAGGATPKKMPFKERNCGTLSTDPASPGLLKEAACIENINHTIGSLDTQMVLMQHMAPMVASRWSCSMHVSVGYFHLQGICFRFSSSPVRQTFQSNK